MHLYVTVRCVKAYVRGSKAYTVRTSTSVALFDAPADVVALCEGTSAGTCMRGGGEWGVEENKQSMLGSGAAVRGVLSADKA